MSKFSFIKGMRKGGTKADSSKFIRKDVAERYAKRFGDAAANKRFSDSAAPANGPGRMRRAAASVMGGARRVKNGYARVKKPFTWLRRKGQQFNSNQMIGGSTSGSLMLWFWISVIFQILDVLFLNLDRRAYLPMVFGFYLLFAIIMYFKFGFHRGAVRSTKTLITFTLISAFHVFVPLYLYIIPDVAVLGPTSLAAWAQFFFAILPLWPLYIGKQANIPIVKLYINVWVFILFILFVFGVGFRMSPGTLAKYGARTGYFEAGIVADYLIEKAGDSVMNIGRAFNLVSITGSIMNATGLNYYTGMVDNNEKEPVGLYLKNVRTADKVAYVGSPAYIWADVRGKSFTEEIVAFPSCPIPKGAKSGVTVKVYPEKMSFFGEEHDSFQCEFTGLQKGAYVGTAGVSFNFDTWAYVTYTFSDLDAMRAMTLQGKSPNKELDVNKIPMSVYSNGPVLLGMSSMVDQPVGVDVEGNTREPVIGATLENVWTKGKIELVKKLVLIIPNDFDLVSCDRDITKKEDAMTPEKPPKPIEGYTAYYFERDTDADMRLGYQSVTCRLHIKDPKKLIGNSQKVQRTFVALASYDYTVQERVTIRVNQ